MKTLKNLIWMVALTLTAATWSACSNEDVPTAAEQPAQSRTFTVTTTLSPRNGGTRSTMTDNGDGSISAEWEVNDQIWVLYTKTNDTPEEAMATVTAVDPSTKAATIRVTLTDPKEGDSNISFGYPYNFFHAPKDPRNYQTGTLDEINTDFAAISGTGEMTVSGSDVTLPAVTMMEPSMCIWKFSFTDGTDDITSAITKLVIDFPGYGMTYTVSPTSLDNIYVAMYGGIIIAQPICITAETATGFYRKAAASVTLDAGFTYTSPDLALKKAEVGRYFGADGGIYDEPGNATAAGTEAVAKIFYVGNDAETSTTYNHGLALALEDLSGTRFWCYDSETCLGTGHQFDSEAGAKGDMAGIDNTDALVNNTGHTHAAASAARNYNSGSHPTGTSAWFLPSAGQWDKMATAAGSYANLKTNAGLQELASYWSSTEYDASRAWFFDYSVVGWLIDNKDNEYLVRACLAF